MKEVIKKIGFDIKDTINANNTTQTIQQKANQELLITGLLIGKNEDINVDTGEVKTVEIGVLKTHQGMISTISPTVIDVMKAIIEHYPEGDIIMGLSIKVLANKTAKGREFYSLEIL